jgi:hypothetical protein
MTATSCWSTRSSGASNGSGRSAAPDATSRDVGTSSRSTSPPAGGWSQLCELLEVTEPAEPFPWANRDQAKDD